jgi:hypothetical protein
MTGDIVTRPIDLLRFVSLENEQFLACEHPISIWRKR